MQILKCYPQIVNNNEHTKFKKKKKNDSSNRAVMKISESSTDLKTKWAKTKP